MSTAAPVPAEALERCFAIDCAGERLPAILHPGAPGAARGVLVVVGGPQTRVGSHRQFVLLARQLAAAGVPVLRFDYRGMGDADGEARSFEDVDADLAAACAAFRRESPGLGEIVIWGLCDAASAALFHAWRAPQGIAGLVLLNPWVRTDTGEARAYLGHYYRRRLLSAAPWKKMLRGEFDFRGSLRSAFGLLRRALARTPADTQAGGADDPTLGLALPARMAECLRRFHGPVLLVLSGDDLTAAEFRDCVQQSAQWQALLAEARVTRRELAGANHTFSRRVWRDAVAGWTLEWLRTW